MGLNKWLKSRSPEFNWDWRHLLLIQGYLEKQARGEIQNLMVLCPPQHGKSELLSRYLIWRLERNKRLRIILAAYNQRYVSTLALKARRVLDRGPLRLLRGSKAVDRFEVEEGGRLLAVGIGSGVTGNPCDLALIDDPIKSREEANSDVFRDKVWSWYTDELSTRIQPGGQKCLVLTPWHDDDLRGRILRSSEAHTWTVVKLPALSLGEDVDPLGRPEGEALCEERKSREDLLEQKSLNPFSFQALYQCDPVSEEGALFKRDWFQYCDLHEVPKIDQWVRCYDLAVSMKEQADFTACTLMGVKDGTIYIRDARTRKDEWPAIAKWVEELINEDLAAGLNISVGVEKTGTQLGLVQDLFQRALPIRVPLKGLNPRGDKRQKAAVWASRAEFGKVVLVRGDWNAEFLSQCLTFPNGQHDDLVDSASLAIHYLSQILGGARPEPKPLNPNSLEGMDAYLRGIGKTPYTPFSDD